MSKANFLGIEVASIETKAEIRKRILKLRYTLSSEETCDKSAMIFERLCGLSQYKGAKTVIAYMDYKNEVMTSEFIRKCRRDGKRVALPRVETGQLYKNELRFYEIDRIETDTLLGFKGIMEPDSAVLNRMEEIDLAVIPGVAFDYGKSRIGYGAGYYDRSLCCLRPDCIKAGVAYSIQMVEAIPTGEYDIPMDMVVTEDTIYL